ncbi:MAG: hypothetical protein AB1425_07370 [Actinomycetota bacterium]
MIGELTRPGAPVLARGFLVGRLLAPLLIFGLLICHGAFGAAHELGAEGHVGMAGHETPAGTPDEQPGKGLLHVVNDVAALFVGLAVALWMRRAVGGGVLQSAPPMRTVVRRPPVRLCLPRGPTPVSLRVLRL